VAAITGQRRQALAKKTETGNFAVIGCDSHNCPKYLGVTETYEEAVQFNRNMATMGWGRVAVFDGGLQEVKEK
jgi:hypothetical protein